MTWFEFIVIVLLISISSMVALSLALLVRVMRLLTGLIDLFSEDQPRERLQSMEEKEQVVFNEPVTLMDVLLGRKEKEKFDPNNTGTFKGRQPWS